MSEIIYINLIGNGAKAVPGIGLVYPGIWKQINSNTFSKLSDMQKAEFAIMTKAEWDKKEQELIELYNSLLMVPTPNMTSKQYYEFKSNQQKMFTTHKSKLFNTQFIGDLRRYCLNAGLLPNLNQIEVWIANERKRDIPGGTFYDFMG